MGLSLAQEVFSMIEVALNRSSGAEFELAYNARLAIDRIRFAIRATEQLSRADERLDEVRMQLLGALDRLEAADRSFQRRLLHSSDSTSSGIGLMATAEPSGTGA